MKSFDNFNNLLVFPIRVLCLTVFFLSEPKNDSVTSLIHYNYGRCCRTRTFLALFSTPLRSLDNAVLFWLILAFFRSTFGLWIGSLNYRMPLTRYEWTQIHLHTSSFCLVLDHSLETVRCIPHLLIADLVRSRSLHLWRIDGSNVHQQHLLCTWKISHGGSQRRYTNHTPKRYHLYCEAVERHNTETDLVNFKCKRTPQIYFDVRSRKHNAMSITMF